MAAIEFEDGSVINVDEWSRIMSIVKQRSKEGKPKAVSIKQNGVTVNVGSYDKDGPEHANYIEFTHSKWKVRVWRKQKESVYGCNYFKGEDIRYLELSFNDVRDENGVFKYVSSIIDDI